MNAVYVSMIGVIAEFVLQEQTDEDTSCHPHGKAKDVDERVKTMPKKIAERCAEITQGHFAPILKRENIVFYFVTEISFNDNS